MEVNIMAEGISSSLSGVNYLEMVQSASNGNSSTQATASEKTSDKSTNEILNELKQDGMSSSMSAQDIADEYGISLAKAQQILDEIKGEDNGFTIDNPIPEDSTVSFHV